MVGPRVMPGSVGYENGRPFACTYEGCPWRFPSKKDLKKHRDSIHKEGALLHCSFGCGYNNRIKSNLNAHHRLCKNQLSNEVKETASEPAKENVNDLRQQSATTFVHSLKGIFDKYGNEEDVDGNDTVPLAGSEHDYELWARRVMRRQRRSAQPEVRSFLSLH